MVGLYMAPPENAIVICVDESPRSRRWVFDDPRVGLNQEPFVSGADAMIDRVVADVPNADSGFTLVFSSTPFPGHQYQLSVT